MDDNQNSPETALTPEQKFEKNYLFLTNSLARLGFEAVFDGPLKTAMKLDRDNISLQAELQGKEDKMLFTPKFTRNGGDYYFLNSVEVTLTRNNAHPVTHDFFLYQQRGYDIRQMKNMLEGRSVYSTYREDGRQVELYRKIDFSAKDERGNNIVRSTYVDGNRYNLEVLLNKLPVNNMTAPEKAAIISDLKNGDRVGVTMRQGANRERMFLEAAPQQNVIAVFNAEGARVQITQNQLRLVEKTQENTLPDTTKQLMESQTKNQQPGQEEKQGQTRKRAS